MASVEHSIPSQCPSCHQLLATDYLNHCRPGLWCGWIRHAVQGCDVIIDTRSGRWMKPGGAVA